MSLGNRPNTQRSLSLIERRVLGVLVEKQKTTDNYPLTLNSLTVGCNQKSNRDPVLDLQEHQVEECLERLQQDGFVIRVISGRVDKWKHRLYDAWGVSSAELAIVAELLLRGPQTEGELRSHVSRMEALPDLESLRGILAPLVDRQLVIYLSEPGRRGTLVTHGFHDPDELQHLRERLDGQQETVLCRSSKASPGVAPTSSAEIAELREAVIQMRIQLQELQTVVQKICKDLGVDPSAVPATVQQKSPLP
jgi:uncharacterized protein YceH (UPF0502 family)